MNGASRPIGIIFLLVACGLGLAVGENGKDQAASLFNGRDLDGWIGRDGEATNWRAVEGELQSVGGKDGVRLLLTDRDYADFDFSMQFNAPAEVNTGVFFRTPAEGDGRPAFVGNEIQIVDEKAARYAEKMTADRRMGAHYGVAPPRVEPPALRAGEWQSFRLRCEGSQLKVWIDEVLVQDADLAAYPDELQKTHPGLSRVSGRIGLQSKDVSVRFRDLRLAELN